MSRELQTWKERPNPQVFREYTRHTMEAGLSYSSRRKRDPITSYGIILYYLEEITRPESMETFQRPVFLISQRRDTISFIEFMKGNHNRFNIPVQLAGMTNDERERLLNHSFDEIWDDLWFNHNLKIYQQEYRRARTCYESIEKNLPSLFEKHPSQTQRREWGFPKGKKFQSETDRECALREFREETRYPTDGLIHRSPRTFVENYRGTNRKMYRTVYFLAQTMEKFPIRYEQREGILRSRTISEELGDLKWVTLEESIDYLGQRKYDLLKDAHDEVMTLHVNAFEPPPGLSFPNSSS